MKHRAWIAPSLLLVTVVGAGSGLAVWKAESLQQADAAFASQPEPMMAVTTAVAEPYQHQGTTTAIGTVLAMRSITLRNELPGSVEWVRLTPGQIVDKGTVLVQLDVSVEEAELEALRAQAALAETLLERHQLASLKRAVSEVEVDRARAERDVARAQIARVEAIIARKTLRAPFRARVGLADVHPGQYLDTGTEVTTLQGIDAAAHVDFAVAQAVASTLRKGDTVDVFVTGTDEPLRGEIVAIDARVDATTRNATVRARIENGAQGPVPGASVRVELPVGAPREAVVVPASALRKGPDGDHLYVIAGAEDGRERAELRPVASGALVGDRVMIHSGLAAGERVAASGSFKLYPSALVAAVDPGAGDTAAGDTAVGAH